MDPNFISSPGPAQAIQFYTIDIHRIATHLPLYSTLDSIDNHPTTERMSLATKGKQRASRRRRWFWLFLGIGFCALFFSLWTEGQPRWQGILHCFMGLACLAGGIYEFTRKGNGEG